MANQQSSKITGSSKDYRFGQKNNWRRTISERQPSQRVVNCDLAPRKTRAEVKQYGADWNVFRPRPQHINRISVNSRRFRFPDPVDVALVGVDRDKVILRNPLVARYVAMRPRLLTYKSGLLRMDSAVFEPVSRGRDERIPAKILERIMAEVSELETKHAEPDLVRQIAAVMAVRTKRLSN